MNAAVSAPSRASRASRLLMAGLVALGLAAGGAGAAAAVPQAEPSQPERISPAALAQAIARLGDVDDAARAAAARTIRRVPAAEAVPALVQAVLKDADQYVRYKALVLLTGFGGPQVRDTVGRVMQDRNDRLRLVAYKYFEHHPGPDVDFALLAALDHETAEFVRPALIRALAAHGRDPAVQQALLKELGHGRTFFRSAVIEALGDYRATYAVGPLLEIIRQDPALRDDAVLALGKIGDRRALSPIIALQAHAAREAQPEIAAAICLLGLHCQAQLGFLDATLRFAQHHGGFQPLLRATVRSLAAVGVRGNADALRMLLAVGVPAHDAARPPIALAVAAIALRNTPFMLASLAKDPDRAGAIALLADGFDMLEDDFEKEQFFVTVRHDYWSAPAGSATRRLMVTLIEKLDF